MECGKPIIKKAINETGNLSIQSSRLLLDGKFNVCISSAWQGPVAAREGTISWRDLSEQMPGAVPPLPLTACVGLVLTRGHAL